MTEAVGGFRVLIVEDDFIDLELARRQLKKCSEVAEITSVSNGQEALEHIMAVEPAHLPDWIFLDLRMPIMDGRTFLSQAPHVVPPGYTPRVLVLSASASDPARLEVLSHPWVESYIVKPLFYRDAQRLIRQPPAAHHAIQPPAE